MPTKVAPKSKTTTRKYGPKASAKVEAALHKMKAGKLKSGGSGKAVKSRPQAIAIGLSEARKSGAKVPPTKPGKTSSRTKSKASAK
jgi:hypothetical protein